MKTARVSSKESIAARRHLLCRIPRKEILFELLLDKQQSFSIKADSVGLPNSVAFTGSADNTSFQDYTKFANTTGMAIGKINTEYASASNKKDSAAITTRIKTLSDKMQQHRDSIAKNNRAPSSPPSYWR